MSIITSRHMKLDEAAQARADVQAERLYNSGSFAMKEDSVFFSRELELISQEIAMTKYADLDAEKLLPNRIQVPEGVDTYTWKLFDMRGAAVPMSGSDSGAPLAQIEGEEMSAYLQSFKIAYGWDVEEIAKARHTGLALDPMRAEAARRALAEKMNYVALLGHSNKSIKGLFNLATTRTYTVPDKAASGTNTKWTVATADEILTDMFAMVDDIPDNSANIESPKRLLLPHARLRLISRTPRTSTDSKTVLQYFMENRPGVEVMGANLLDTAGAGSTMRAVAYDPAQVKWLVSVPFNQLPPQVQGFRTVVNAYGRFGGVITSYPKSVLYADDI